MSTIKFEAAASAESGTRTLVKARQFQITIDEPASMGGSDRGANPVEYVLAALCGCLNVVAHVVAKELDLDLRGLTMEAEGDLDPARFQGKSTDARAGYREIRVRLTPDMRADEYQRAAWLQAVNERCPVSDNLKRETPVKITFG